MAAANGHRRVIDLRSDTVTKPTADMMAALAALTPNDFGDDVYCERSSATGVSTRQTVLFALLAVSVSHMILRTLQPRTPRSTSCKMKRRG